MYLTALISDNYILRNLVHWYSRE